MPRDSYAARVETIALTWRVWADLGAGLTDAQWRTPTRCAGWDVAALYAHHSAFPLVLSQPPPAATGSAGPALAAVEVLQRYNAPGGVATTMAPAVADRAAEDAARLSRAELVARFAEVAPRAVEALAAADPDLLVPWPAAEGSVPLGEGLRIVLMEAAVHLLDVERALGREPAVPAAALRETALLLAEMAPAADLVEALTGRAPGPVAVLR